MIFRVPEVSLILLVGPSGAGKSTFARRYFRATEVVSSDQARAAVCDDEDSLDATRDAFQIVNLITRKRLGRAKLTVIDATNVEHHARKSLLNLARIHNVGAAAIVFNLPQEIFLERNRLRPGRVTSEKVVAHQTQLLKQSLVEMEEEGFVAIHVITDPAVLDCATIERVPLDCNFRHDAGPFDIIGDIHGCFDELVQMLEKLGCDLQPDANGVPVNAAPPTGRKVIFVGDMVDRGPRIPDVLRLVMNMVKSGHAYALPGNHDMKLKRVLLGHDIPLKHGLRESADQMNAESQEFRDEVLAFLLTLPAHLVLDGGALVVAHAGLTEQLQGRESRKVRDFALFGEPTGKVDEYGLPIRYNWTLEYRGKAAVVYGHTPVSDPVWMNNTINIDTGCVFGGRLTALRWPERDLVSVAARETYVHTPRPMRGLV